MAINNTTSVIHKVFGIYKAPIKNITTPKLQTPIKLATYSQAELKYLLNQPALRGPKSFQPLFIMVTGGPGSGKSFFTDNLLQSLSGKTIRSFEYIGFGNEMKEATRTMQLDTHRDEMRTKPLEWQKGLIDTTLSMILNKYNDENKIYLLDCHPLVKTDEGFMLGVNPFPLSKQLFYSYAGTIQRIDDPNMIAERSKADTSRIRETDPNNIKLHQDNLHIMNLLNQNLTTLPFIEVELPNFKDVNSPETKKIIEIEGRKAVGTLLSHQQSPADLTKIFNAVGENDSFDNLSNLRETGELYKLFPIFSLQSPGTIDHIFDALGALDKLSKGKYKDIYNNIADKDATYSKYSKNTMFFNSFYNKLTPEGKKTLWLEVLLHDTGKVVDWGSRHYFYGKQLTYNMFINLGFDNSGSAILSDIVKMHGYSGDIIMGDGQPADISGLLSKYPNATGKKIMPFITMVNVCDFIGWRQGSNARHEYLSEFKDMFDINYHKGLEKYWLTERLKRFSKPTGKIFLGEFDQKLYEATLNAYKTEIPKDEIAIFNNIHSKVLDSLNLSALMINLSPKNKVRYMHFFALVTKAFIEKGLVPKGIVHSMHVQGMNKNMNCEETIDDMFNNIWPLKYKEIKEALEATDYKNILGHTLEIENGGLLITIDELGTK